MPITLKTIQVVASNGNGVGGNIPQALSNYAAALNQRSPQQVVFQGNPFLDNLALDAAFLMKVAGSGGLENDVQSEPSAVGHDVDPGDPAQWVPPSSRVGVVHAVTNQGFLGARYQS